MLQITVEHYKDETVSVQKICEDSTVLAVMQDTGNSTVLAVMQDTGTIDLDVCIPFINQQIEVHHNYVDDNEKSYVLTAKLEAIEIDPITQVKCIRYTPIHK